MNFSSFRLLEGTGLSVPGPRRSGKEGGCSTFHVAWINKSAKLPGSLRTGAQNMRDPEISGILPETFPKYARYRGFLKCSGRCHEKEAQQTDQAQEGRYSQIEKAFDWISNWRVFQGGKDELSLS